MPTRDDHIDQANRNRSFWGSLDIPAAQHLDWIVVGMFYEAVHWIEAYFALSGYHSKSHRQRESDISNFPDLANDPDLVIDYGLLRSDSENARYWCYRPTASQISSDLLPAIDRVSLRMRSLLGI